MTPEKMVSGIKEYLLARTAASVEGRAGTRERLREIIGAVDPRPERVEMELVATTDEGAVVAEGDGYRALRVRWEAGEGFHGEGLLLEPVGEVKARVVAIPDADVEADECDYALHLVASGCQVLVPAIVSRDDTWSGHPSIRYTNQPHREFVYRMAFEMGRHIIGFEVQKVLAGVDWFAGQGEEPIGVIGYGEGGLLALYAAALDERIAAACVSGYFGPREGLYREPIYRNVFGLLRDFGDAGVAKLVAPRALIVEASGGPEVSGPPEPREGRSGAAPGRIETPTVEDVRAEAERAGEHVRVVVSGDGTGPHGTEEALGALLAGLGVGKKGLTLFSGDGAWEGAGAGLGEKQRKRGLTLFSELCEWTQVLLRRSERVREELWAGADTSSVEAYETSTAGLREVFRDEVIGSLPAADVPANARTRLVYDEETWRGYEVVLDVWEGVIAQGILLVPKDIEEGERRPVVVCQHGLEGTPRKTIDEEFGAYNQYAARLADRGFITYAPQNPYIGEDKFRELQRLLNPLGLTLFSVIVRQHERTLEWLNEQAVVDARRVGFYGISYGGVSAMRLPALIPDYCLSICSANFNDWARKVASNTFSSAYPFTGEFEMPHFNLAHTLDYAEMAALIAPRPFMVERGHQDGVATDSWVGYEYAKVRRLYAALGIPERTEIEYFEGGHEIHGVGTFEFLHRHLQWPEQ